MTWQSVSEGIAQARREMSARERRDVTGDEIAKALGVTPAAYSRWEKGERTPNEAAVQKLATFFGVTPAYLRYGVRSEEPIARGQFTDEEIAAARARVAAKRADEEARKRKDDPPDDPPEQAVAGGPRRPRRPRGQR